MITTIFCKYCGERCVKKVSRTKDNPGRIFWACPMEWGGHGWMEWVDYSPSPQGKRGTQLEKISALERMLDEVEDRIVQLDEENKNLKERLKNEIVLTNCLKKFLKGIFVGFCIALVFIVCSVSNGEMDNVALGP
ncbi:hypothetical protein Leryth_017050 [Lithospermum erythrorhizon]|nr:hypothetical protein Leryth_017050 [Lithospermum erythrorhizon]